MSYTDPTLKNHCRESSGWLYNFNVPSGSELTVHIPLVYLTKLPIQQEAYAKSLIDFPIFLETVGFHPILTSYATVNFDRDLLECFKSVVMQEIYRGYILDKVAKQFQLIQKWFPKYCLQQENLLMRQKKLSPHFLIRLFNLLCRSISLSLLIPFVESIYLTKLNTTKAEEHFHTLVQDIVLQPLFSHFIFFNKELDILKTLYQASNLTDQDIYSFCFQYGFLGNAYGDGSEYESPKFLYQKITEKPDIVSSYEEELPLVQMNHLTLPTFLLDPTGMIDGYNRDLCFDEKLLYSMRILQVNEEFRHYWGIRLIRLFRLIAPDYTAQQEWTLKDYVRYYQK